jgi:hypothetical protein
LFASLALGVALVSANAQTPQGGIATSLTVEQARAIVAPLYEALNEPFHITSGISYNESTPVVSDITTIIRCYSIA